MLPDEIILTTLNEQFPCREFQIRQLLTLLSPRIPNPSAFVVHGLNATGKTATVKAVLETLKVTHTIINSRECITGRHLLERTLVSCLDAVEKHSDTDTDRSLFARCESISTLCVQLQRLLENQERLVLVLDGIDQQREAPPTLLPALSRFGEIIPNLTVIFIVTVPQPRHLHSTGVPHVHFPSYTRDQCIQILDKDPPLIFLETTDSEVEYSEEEAIEDRHYVWSRFLAAVWDSLAKGAARDLVSFRAAAEKLWRLFVAPIVDGTFGTRDFARLMVNRRAMFQSEDVIVESVIPREVGESQRTVSRVTHDLPYYSKYILCAAYLASYNPARQDPVYFMKASEKKRRKKGGATAPGRVSKRKKIPRHLLTPSPFALDRLLAILHAILPHRLPQTSDIYTQIATLGSLRLLLKGGTAGADVLDPSCRWRVNFGWDYVAALGRSVGFEVAEYLAGGGE